MARRLLCLHGHFYQPPRENPWIEAIEVQDTAEPFHDWNERIAAECYGPNGAARLKGAERPDPRHRQQLPAPVVQLRPHAPRLAGARPARVLCARHRGRPAQRREPGAGERHRAGIRARHPAARQRARPQDPGTLGRHRLPEALPPSAPGVLAPRDGGRLGHPGRPGRGRHPLHHPLAVPGAPRAPAGRTPGTTRATPGSIRRVRTGSGWRVASWWSSSTTATSPATWPSATRWARRASSSIGSWAGSTRGRGHDEILTVAFDGETLGHHKKGGDEVLAAALRQLLRRERRGAGEPGAGARAHPSRSGRPEIVEGSSWSCVHGVERWRSDCGCNTGGAPGWRQTWRAPLRARAGLAARPGGRDLRAGGRGGSCPIRGGRGTPTWSWCSIPSGARPSEFLRREAGRELSPEQEVHALRLLEMERQALLMFTSCGWFFSELSGIETVQVLKYAARAIQLARDLVGLDLEPDLEVEAGAGAVERPGARRRPAGL